MALVNITAASPADIRALRVYLSSSSAAFAEATAPKGEADPPSRLRVNRISQKIFFPYAVSVWEKVAL